VSWKSGARNNDATIPFAAWRGTSLSVVVGWIEYRKGWAGMYAYASSSSPRQLRAKSSNVSFGHGLFPNGGDLAACARGEYDDEQREVARRLVANGVGDAEIRLGWEASGDWFAWSAAGKPADAGLLCVVRPMDGLRLDSFHRRVPGPVDLDELLQLLSEDFQVQETGRPHVPPVGGSMGVYVSRRWFEITYDGEPVGGVAGLDVSILQSRVLDRLDPAPAGRTREVETIPATSPLDQLAARCDVDSGALFTLAPPTPDALVEVADGGEVMPPKTTYFEPKPATGIFLR
jgi:hypothetical protein